MQPFPYLASNDSMCSALAVLDHLLQLPHDALPDQQRPRAAPCTAALSTLPSMLLMRTALGLSPGNRLATMACKLVSVEQSTLILVEQSMQGSAS